MEIALENTQQIDDQIIMKDLLARLPEALERLHRKYHDLLKSIIMQALHDETEADDVLQEVLLQVWERASTYSAEKGKLVSWLCTLARRRAIDRVRQFSAYHRATDRYEISCNHDRKETEEFCPVDWEVDRDDLRSLLQDHLSELPPSQKEVICMAYFEDRSQREISVLTHTPLGTVKTRLELGIKKLAISIGNLRDKIL
ncbi:MAG: hypothetical protein A3F67_09100 [Verrucomicrobia bacterium RIFCSPHIGHO2_12_FULL_41_10]|nr:MAG: hypothetical protein A3F67_09100 [Verrucomicrobia bacterium RIFCSPHIGHO2_12_FULL_41_10]HLB33050.1 sigma-70 family RNA polymerase sigma factor [Chthoniobacterales bacterium]